MSDKPNKKPTRRRQQPKAPKGPWRNRIVGYGEEAPDQLLANPRNWRIHPRHQQKALSGVLHEVGIVQNIIVNRTTGFVLDGHIRAAMAISENQPTIPVTYVELTEEEERLILATFDSLGMLAVADNEDLRELVSSIEASSDDLNLMLKNLSDDASLAIDSRPAWKELWVGMPEFIQDSVKPFQSVLINFEDQEDRDAFARLTEIPITPSTSTSWYPVHGRIDRTKKRWITAEPVEPRYPVYIISKGRWKLRHTSKALERMEIPYHIVIEPQEYDEYAAVIDPAKILKLPFSDLGQGSIPARNWVWKHSQENGAMRHWILDDNIKHFFRFNRGRRAYCDSGAIFRAAEDFVDRYENIALAGFQYSMFVPEIKYGGHADFPPLLVNTRIYSCILIQNDIPYEWRGKYNEDTDLSLRALKDGWCTILFDAFLAGKQRTMAAKGGNTDELYRQDEEGDGRLDMAISLQKQHPDVVTITQKYGRWQHQVDYRKFRANELIRKPGVEIPTGINDYGMRLITLKPEEKP